MPRLLETIDPGRTLRHMTRDVLAYFERLGMSSGATEAFNCKLEHSRGTTLGFRNLVHHATRSLLYDASIKSPLHPFFKNETI